MKWNLIRVNSNYDHTFGILIDNNLKHRFFTLELPWRNNKKAVSRIPPGIYPCRKRFSTKFQDECFEVCGVPNRFGILFHVGNTSDDIQGCILLGEDIGTLKDKDAVLKSRSAFTNWYKILGDIKEFTLMVVDSDG